MQLYALDSGSPIPASKAEKGKDYICPECASSLRVRGGPTRQTHFYHLSLPKQCRQHEKSEEHIQLQLKLLELVTTDSQMECPFPAIRRVADVAWHAKKLIFEIQCSPISLEEVQCRILDYTSIGYEVIWILHENQFNQKNLSAAENFLRNTPCYFTDVDETGYGTIYDQFEVIKDHKRLFKGPPLTVSFDKFARIPLIAPYDLALPKAVAGRFTNWKCYMEGDLLHRLLKEGTLSQSVKNMLNIENRILKGDEAEVEKLPLNKLVANSYRSFINYILKKLTSR
ncbi:MAG: competence protein CoiA family protein [Rhabdochlamydiaceae bacterium]|jgi:competence protein CoiA